MHRQLASSTAGTNMMLCILAFAALLSASSCGDAHPHAADSARQAARVDSTHAATPATSVATNVAASATTEPLTAEERQRYRDMAKVSWSYMDANYQSASGFVNATPDWANTTLWDVGGQIIAFVAAKELGYIAPDQFDERMTKTLKTLEHTDLFRNVAFSKQYSTSTGRVSNERTGWSATDLGRFLVALRILAVNEPQYAAQAEQIAHRNDFSQIVKDGYLQGEVIGSSGQPWAYQEGRIGYEQYIARGFAAWGANVSNALDVKRNAQPVDVLGVSLLADKRANDRLLSEPFILYGLELGLDGDMRDLAQKVLQTQEARYKSTGKVTIVSEDAVSVPPEYFYYYCVYCSGKPFVIDGSTPGKAMSGPRWVSTKAAYAWNALFPSDYTRLAVDYVNAAKDPKRGWASGIYEDSKKSTNTFDINTAAVLMEVAFYRLRGDVPLIQKAAVAPAGTDSPVHTPASGK